MNLIKNLVSESKWAIKCPYQMTPQFIVVHNTANDATAQEEISFMNGNNETTSYHYAVDDHCVVQGVLETRSAWHAGDGMGPGNTKGIAIEICYSKSGGDQFLKSEDNAVELIVDILNRYGWDLSHVTKHQDYSGKYCPHRTLDMGWDRFINKVEEKMGGLTMAQYEELKGLLQKIEKRLSTLESKMIYNYIDQNMPDWAKPTIQKLVNRKLLVGNEKGELQLTEELLRTYVILDRAGAFK